MSPEVRPPLIGWAWQACDVDDRETLVLAVAVDSTSVDAAVLDADSTIMARATEPTRRGRRLTEAIIRAGESALRDLPREHRSRVWVGGIAMPGRIDAGRGVCELSVELGVRDQAVTGPVAARLGLPLALGHDVRVAGFAEHRTGPPEARDPLVVHLGSSIGSALIVHGVPVDGVSGRAGQLGHVVVHPGGRDCACGSRGCLETITSTGAIAQQYSKRSGRPVTDGLDVVALVGHDAHADLVWREATDALGDALHDVCALVAPGEIVLGGPLAEAGDQLIDRVRDRLWDYPAIVGVPTVRTMRLGSDAVLIGAGLLARDVLDSW